MTAKEKVLELLNKKADNDNTIDLNAYAMGLQDMVKTFQSFISNMEDIPPEFNKVIDEKFWELLSDTK